MNKFAAALALVVFAAVVSFAAPARRGRRPDAGHRHPALIAQDRAKARAAARVVREKRDKRGPR